MAKINLFHALLDSLGAKRPLSPHTLPMNPNPLLTVASKALFDQE